MTNETATAMDKMAGETMPLTWTWGGSAGDPQGATEIGPTWVPLHNLAQRSAAEEDIEQRKSQVLRRHDKQFPMTLGAEQ